MNKKSVAICASCLVAMPALAQTGDDPGPKDLTIDLSQGSSSTVSAPGTYRLHLTNRVPGVSYSTSTTLSSNKLAAPFDNGILKAAKENDEGAPKLSAIPLTCDMQKEEVKKKLDGAKCELAVASIRQSYGATLSKCMPDEKKEFVDGVVDPITEWRDTNALPALEAGDVLKVTVSRAAIEGDETGSCQAPSKQATDDSGVRTLGTWTYKFGKSEAQWLVYYGFNFARAHDESFYSKTNAGTDPATFTITRSADRGGKAFSPSLYVFRLPAEDGGNFISWRHEDTMGGLTAGLGFDFDNPTVFFGYGIGWGYNVMLNAGVVMHKEKRLKGQYNEGDTVSENLTSDQLLDSTYKPRAYVGLAFRFGSNPFKTGGS